jgi:hypothetical protein
MLDACRAREPMGNAFFFAFAADVEDFAEKVYIVQIQCLQFADTACRYFTWFRMARHGHPAIVRQGGCPAVSGLFIFKELGSFFSCLGVLMVLTGLFAINPLTRNL